MNTFQDDIGHVTKEDLLKASLVAVTLIIVGLSTSSYHVVCSSSLSYHSSKNVAPQFGKLNSTLKLPFH